MTNMHWKNCSFSTNFSPVPASRGRNTKLYLYDKNKAAWGLQPQKTEKIYCEENIFTEKLERHWEEFEQKWQKYQKFIHNLKITKKLTEPEFLLLSSMLATNYVRHPKYHQILINRKIENDKDRKTRGLPPIDEPHGEPILAVANFFNGIMLGAFRFETHRFYLKIFDTDTLKNNKSWIACPDISAFAIYDIKKPFLYHWIFPISYNKVMIGISDEAKSFNKILNNLSSEMINYLSFSHHTTESLLCYDKINFVKPNGADVYRFNDLIML